MDFKKLNGIQKVLLKLSDKKKYRDYKALLRDYEFYLGSQEVNQINIDHPFKAVTHFKHSGNSGDIIYALPAIFALAKNGKAHFHLNLGEKADYGHFFHPLGNIMLTEKMLEMLKPLLEYQPLIEVCDAYTSQPIDYDLDIFRKAFFLLDRGSISRWYFNIFGVDADLSQPWLIAPKDETVADHIVIARSHRYRSPGIDYSFLKKYPKKTFIGLPVEYDEMKLQVPDIEYRPVNNFLEMAAIINGSKLFIGNQTFAFSIAEALKVNRLLELYYVAPNVVVEGKGGHDFFFQPHFERLVSSLYEEP